MIGSQWKNRKGMYCTILGVFSLADNSEMYFGSIEYKNKTYAGIWRQSDFTYYPTNPDFDLMERRRGEGQW